MVRRSGLLRAPALVRFHSGLVSVQWNHKIRTVKCSFGMSSGCFIHSVCYLSNVSKPRSDVSNTTSDVFIASVQRCSLYRATISGQAPTSSSTILRGAYKVTVHSLVPHYSSFQTREMISGQLFFLLVTEFLHVKPGKGAAFVRTKLRNYITGNTIEKTFRAGESVS